MEKWQVDFEKLVADLCAEDPGFKHYAHGDNRSARMAKLLVEEFNRAQAALREELLERSSKVSKAQDDGLLTSYADYALPIPVTMDFVSTKQAKTFCCLNQGCTRKEVTADKPPACYTCGEVMKGVVMQVRLPEKYTELRGSVKNTEWKLKSLSPDSYTRWTEPEIMGVVKQFGGSNINIFCKRIGETTVDFWFRYEGDDLRIWGELMKFKPAGVTLVTIPRKYP